MLDKTPCDQVAEIILRTDVALRRRSPVPTSSAVDIGGDPEALLIHNAEIVFRARIAALGQRLPHLKRRGVVAALIGGNTVLPRPSPCATDQHGGNGYSGHNALQHGAALPTLASPHRRDRIHGIGAGRDAAANLGRMEDGGVSPRGLPPASQNDQAAPAQADPPLEMLCDTVPGVVLLMIAPVLPLLRMVVAPAPVNDEPSVPKIDAVPPTKNRRNASHLHQFIYRGTPRVLDQETRATLAACLGCRDEDLRHSVIPPRKPRSRKARGEDRGEYRPSREGFAAIAEIDVRASAGPGAFHEGIEEAKETWLFPDSIIRHEFRARPADLRMITIDGDSMEPLISSGDRILIDTSQRVPVPPGIFVIWDGLGLVAKRVEHEPNSEPATVIIRSVNPDYPTYERLAEEINIVGRVIWTARRL